MERNLNPQESLKIIEEMIHSAKANFKENSFYFIFWGWVIIIAEVAQLLISSFTDYAHPYYVWFIIFPAMFIAGWYGYSKGRKMPAMSHIVRINIMTWFSFLVSYLILVIFSGNHHYTVPVIFILAGNATFLTGIIIKFKPLVFGGIVLWIGAICMFYLSGIALDIVTVLALVFGYLIPGYMLKYHKEDA
ncbi:MAG: hypothetical protein WC833_03900 [Bacteroidales bacterium]|jgi:hypothetical protein